MPQTPAEETVLVAERLRQLLARTAWPAGLQVMASWDVAQAARESELDDAMRAADWAMYRAKHAGRNRVMSASA
jgi:diguanylate cyclase (GGDEF)-like protein